MRVWLVWGAWFSAAVTLPATSQSRVSGVIYDSLARAPLAHAHVQFMPLDLSLEQVARRTVDSDSAGRFVVEALPNGRYLIGFFHAKLDSLGLDPPLQRVDVRSGRSLTLDLAVPSAESVVRSWCGEAAADDSAGLIVGVLRDARSQHVLADGEIGVRWSAITFSARGARAGVQGTAARTTPLGRYGLCGVPRGANVLLRARHGADSTTVLEVEVPEDGVLLRDIALDRAHTEGPPVDVVGRLVSASGDPIRGGRVRLWGTRDEARTDEAGAFRLRTAARGTLLLDARMIGFIPLRRVVDIAADSAVRLDITMTEFATEIDTVRILSLRAPPRDALGGFERRRRLGHGTFIDADQLDVRRSLVFTDVLRGIAGVEVQSVDMMTRALVMRTATGAPCEPVIVVDGIRLPVSLSNIDDLVPVDFVKAIEVYPRHVQTPPEYQGTDCGSVVVWTGLRGWLAKRLKSKDAR